MINKKELISVILPVYNAGLYVEDAINSVLEQTYKNLEIICIDDGSKDNSLAVLKKFGDKILLIDSKENCGQSDARNKGVRMASGEFIAFLDADDLWESNKLSLQMDRLEKDPGLDILFSYSKFFISPDISEAIKKARYLPKDPVPGYIPQTSLMRIDSFKRVGYFDTKWKAGEFIAWFAKAKSMGLSYDIIPDILHLRRIHETNTTITETSLKSDYLKIVKEALDRRRLQKQ